MQILILVLIVGEVLYSTSLRFLWTVDAGDLAGALQLNQLAHPPGYPLYLLCARLFQWLFRISSATFALSLSSGVASIISAVFLLLIFQLLYRYYFNKKAPWYLTLPAVLSVCFVPLWWLYSITQEVFMWSVMFITLIIYISLRGIINKDTGRKSYFFCLALLSFGIFHQYVLVLLIPLLLFSYGFRFRKFRVRDVVASLLILPIGFIPYLFYLSPTVSQTVPRLWYATASLKDLLFIALRQNYGTLTLFSPLGKASFSIRFVSVWNYFVDIASVWNVLLVLITLGILVSFYKRRLLGIILFFIFMVSGPGLFFVYPLDVTSPMTHAILQRFLLYSFPVLGIYLFIGIISLFEILQKLVKKNIPILIAAVLVIFFIPVLFFYKYWGYFQRLAYYDGLERYAKNMLDFVPDKSILVVTNDPFSMPLQYVSYGLSYKKSVTLLPAYLIEDKKMLQLNKPYLISRGVTIPDAKAQTKKVGFIFAQGKTPVYTNYHVDGTKDFVQEGPVYKVTKSKYPIDVSKAEKFYSDAAYISDISLPMFPLYGIEEVKKYLGRSIKFYISHFADKKDYVRAIKFTNLLNTFEPSMDSYYSIGVMYYKMDDCRSAYNTWEKAFKQYSEPLLAQRLSQLSASCFKDLRRANFWNVVYLYAKREYDRVH